MRSRWFHAPSLHGAHVAHKSAGWLELFYDLIFVAAFIQLGNGLSSTVSMESVVSFASAFTALWISWSGFTYFMNRFTVDDFVHRLMVFSQMFTVAFMAFFAGELLAGRHRGFALAYATSQILVASFNFRSWLPGEGREERGPATGAASCFGGRPLVGRGILATAVGIRSHGSGRSTHLSGPALQPARVVFGFEPHRRTSSR